MILPAPETTAFEAFSSTNRFIENEIAARALALSFARGWIDQWAQGASPDLEMDPEAERLLRGILENAGVLDAAMRLSPAFATALQYRDLLEARLWFCNLVAIDIAAHFDQLLTDVPAFMAHSRTFELFRYDLAMSLDEADIAATSQWVRYTTALTKYEAPAALERVNLADKRRMLDVGGNSGEFARQAVTRWPGLSATVFDLPGVCAIGRRHVGDDRRVSFQPGDLRRQGLPGGHDLISFKSMLHDWPDEEARDFLAKAVAALEPGGMLLIFERDRIDARQGLPYWMVANLVFLPFFRHADIYRRWMEELGLLYVEVSYTTLDMPFQLIVARKAA